MLTMILYQPADSQSLATEAAQYIAKSINQHEAGQYVLCVATGQSPLLTYAQLVQMRNLFDTQRLTLVKLDEWQGLSSDHPASCEHYLQQHLVRPLGIPPEQYISFQGEAPEPEAEMERVKSQLEELGRIDLCVLGIGLNGHLGLNEPAPALMPFCHLSTLSPQTASHSMLAGVEPPVRYGYTLGIAQLLQARSIMLLISGAHKREAVRRLMEKKISTDFPASLLWLHPQVHLFIDAEAT
jgi:galactosamine-6-phosphate isomerase